MTENLKIFTDYVLRIRAQGMQLYQTLLAIFIGSILAAAIVASLARNCSGEGGGTSSGGHDLRHLLFILSFVLFIAFLFFLRVRHATIREFCDKWVANHLLSSQEPEEPEVLEVLIRDFSKDHYALVCPGEKDYTVDAKDLPNIWLRDWVRGNLGLLITHFLPAISGACLIGALMIHP